MGILATDKKELIYMYSDTSNLGNKVLAYAQSINKPLRIINVEKEKIADSIWLEIAESIGKPLSELLSPELQGNKDLKNLSKYNTDDLLKIINKNPSLLEHPIGINGKKAISIKDKFDFFEFYDKDGGNFDKSREAIKNGNHKDTTSNNGMNNILK